MTSVYNERPKRKNAFDVDDTFLAQRRYIAESMVADLEVMSIRKESSSSKSSFQSFNPYLQTKRVRTTWDLEGLQEELNNIAPKTKTRSSRRSYRTTPKIFSNATLDLRRELENIRREELAKSEKILDLFKPSNSSATSKQIENALNLSKSFCNVSPFLDLAISNPSNALIVYQPPESLLMKSYHPKVLSAFMPDDTFKEAENEMLTERNSGIESM